MGKTVIYIYVCGQSRTQLMLPNLACAFTTGKVSRIDGASIAIILCLHFLIAHLIFINFGYVDYFQ